MGEEETRAERGRTLRAEGERLGKWVVEIRGPCSLLSLGFVTEKGETAATTTEIPQVRSSWPWANEGEAEPERPVRECPQRQTDQVRSFIPGGTVCAEERWARVLGERSKWCDEDGRHREREQPPENEAVF